MEDKILNELFNKKAEEFMEYQKYIISRIKEVQNELLTKDVIDALLQYQNTKSRLFTTDVLWLKADDRTGCTFVETNPNKPKHVSSRFALGVQEIVYCTPRDIKELKHAIEDFKSYEILLDLMETELPEMIKDLFEWKREYIASEIDYLNNLDFNMPKKSKHYIITIKIEEIETV